MMARSWATASSSATVIRSGVWRFSRRSRQPEFAWSRRRTTLLTVTRPRNGLFDRSKKNAWSVSSSLGRRFGGGRESAAHYHQERNHQGLPDQLTAPAATGPPDGAAIRCRPRLGGLLRYYYRAA